MQWIDYAGSPGTITSYSYSRVHDGKVPPSVFKDKVVVVGATAPSLQDIHATPTALDMAGSRDPGERDRDGARAASRCAACRHVWNIVLIVALGLVVPLVSLRAGPLISVAVGILAFLLFSFGDATSRSSAAAASLRTSIRSPRS